MINQQQSNNIAGYYKMGNTKSKNIYQCLAMIACSIIAIFFIFAGVGIQNHSSNQMTVSAVPEDAYAKITYTLSDDETYYIVSGVASSWTSTQSYVDIDDTYNSLPVKEIDAEAFKDNTVIYRVDIGKNITTIGASAFSGCTGIKTVTFVDGSKCESIGDRAFYNCTSLTSITIPENVTSLGTYAFYNCTGLIEINFNATNCADLISDNSDNYVFYCAGESGDGIAVTFGANVTKVPAYLFYPPEGSYACAPKITSVTFAENSKCKSIGSFAFADCLALTSVNIPESVISIDSNAFTECFNLRTFIFPKSLASLGKGAFNYCTGLESIYLNSTELYTSDSYSSYFSSAGSEQENCTVYIAANVTRIPPYLFLYASITNFEFEENSQCHTIGDRSFEYCSRLQSITIPESVTTIGRRAFYNCTALTEINFNATACADLASGNGVFSYAGQSGDGITINIGEGVTKLPKYLFYSSTTTSELPKIKAINFNATACADLSSSNYTFAYAGQDGDGIAVTFGANVTKVPAYLFYPYSSAAPKITSVTFGDNSVCETFGGRAFAGCTALTSITIPENVTTIEKSVFSGCTGLTEINFNATSCNDLASENQVFMDAGQSGDGIVVTFGVSVINVPAYLFYPYPYGSSSAPKITSVTFAEDSVCKVIGEYAFCKCSSLTSVTIPKSVTTIRSCAFSNCTGLTGVYITNLTAWCNIDFGTYDANPLYSAHNLYLNNELVTELTIPSTITEIKKCTFYGAICLTKLTIPESVTSISTSAFGNCSGLTGVYITNLTAWCNIDFVDYSSNPLFCAKNLYLNNDLVTELTIPAEITVVKAYTFCGASFAKLNIHEGVTSIDSFAFGSCGALTEINFNATSCSVSVSDMFRVFMDAGKSGDGITVNIGENVTKLPNSLFAPDERYPSSRPKIKAINFNATACADLSDSNYTFARVGQDGDGITINIGEGVTKLPKYLFYSSTTTSELPKIKAINFNATACADLSSSNYTFAYAGQDGDGIAVTFGAKVSRVPAYLFCAYTGTAYTPRITSVTFANIGACESIGSSAFLMCSLLTSVYITDLTGWFNIDFESYSSNPLENAGNLYVNNQLITELIIPSTVIEIKRYAFDGATCLKTVAIPACVKKIGYKAFADCSNLEGVYITDISAWCNVELVDEYANPLLYAGNLYLNDELITNLVVPTDVISLSSFNFIGATCLKKITIPKNIQYLGTYTFGGCTKIIEINYNSTVQSVPLADIIGPFAGAGVEGEGITLNIGENVIKVPSYWFSGLYTAPKITTVNFAQNSVCESIGEGAFLQCDTITSIILSDGIKSIEDYAFAYCTSLTSITLPSSVKTIGNSAFEGIEGLIVTMVGSVADGEREDIPQIASSTALSEAIVYVPNADMGLYRAAPYYLNTAVVAELRASSYSLKIVFNVYVDGAVLTTTEDIDPNILTDETAKIDEEWILGRMGDVTRTGYQIEGLYSSKNMLDGEKMESIQDLYKDTTLYLRWKYVGGDWDSIYTIDTTKYKGYTAITGFNKENAVGLVAFEMSDNVTYIGGAALKNNTCIQSMKIGKNVQIISNNAFNLCVNLSSLSFEGNDVLESIGSFAFANCAIKGELALPSSIVSMAEVSGFGQYPFVNTSELGSNAITKFTVIGDTGNIQATEDGLILNADGTKVMLAPNILPSTIELPDSVTAIYMSAFGYTSGLESINGRNVTDVGSSAFWGNTLSYFDFPNLETIGGFAFNNCDNLNTIKLGSKVSTINANAFTNCDNLQTIVLEGAIGSSDRTAIPTLTSSIASNPSDVSVYVNSNDLATYQADSAWSQFNLVGVDNGTVCTVTIDLDGGEGYSANYYIMYGNSLDMTKNPTKEGYQFKNWMKFDGEKWVDYDPESKIYEDITLKATWEVIEYKIVYYLNSGSIDGSSGETYTQIFTIEDFGDDRTKVVGIKTITRDGHTFIGWYTNAEFDSAKVTGIKYSSMTVTQITASEDIYLYAKWDINTFAMTFEDSDAYTITLDSTSKNPVDWNEDFGFVIVLAEGYTQNTAENIVVKIVSAGGVETTLTAQPDSAKGLALRYVISNVKEAYTIKVEGLKKNVYSVYFTTKLDGVAGLSNTLKITHGEKIDASTLTEPTATGYTFLGYYQRVADGENESYSTTKFDFNTLITEDITLLADFDAESYTITLYLNGGKVNNQEKESIPYDTP